jgi:hypothetical protein
VPGAAPFSSPRLQAPAAHHQPRRTQVVNYAGGGQSVIISGFQLSAIFGKPPLATPAAALNPHKRSSAHRSPAGSFFGGFRTPAPIPGRSLAPGRHPKPFPTAVVRAELRERPVSDSKPGAQDNGRELPGRVDSRPCPTAFRLTARADSGRSQDSGLFLSLVAGDCRKAANDFKSVLPPRPAARASENQEIDLRGVQRLRPRLFQWPGRVHPGPLPRSPPAMAIPDRKR